jgi:hypothetical protein
MKAETWLISDSPEYWVLETMDVWRDEAGVAMWLVAKLKRRPKYATTH